MQIAIQRVFSQNTIRYVKNRLFLCLLVVSTINLSLFSQTKTYTENFEGSTTDLNEAPWTISGYGTTVEGTNMGTGTATIIDDPTEIGNRIMKVDKRVPPPGEKYDVNSCREEIKYLSKAKDIPGAPDAFPPWFTPLTFRWRFYFTGDHDWDKPENGNFGVASWHHSTQVGISGGAPASFRVSGNNLRFKARWASPEDPTNEDVKEANYLVWEDLQKNTWYYIAVDITWDYREGETGQVKAYMKEGGWPSASDLVMDHSGPGKAIGYNWTLTNWPQVGLYAWRWRNPLGADQSREAGVEKFEFYIDDWEYTQGKHSFSDNSNQLPNADAGPSKTITLPNDNVTLNGTASDPDGSITSYQWTQQQGPNSAVLTGADNASMEVNGLIEGVYIFRLTVTDDDGAIASDEVSVTVGPPSNQEPIADAGPSKTITLPTNQAILNGSGSDPDGYIVSYLWDQVSGPATATLKGTNTADAEVTDLIEGTYVFRLTVTDDDGALGSDKMFVSVQPAPNQPPHADAGPNQSITLPDDKVTLNGTASDPDGSITSYQWTQQEGPSNAILTGAENASMEAGGLIEGAYVFRLTITDDQEALAYDEVSVTIEPAPNQQPNADAGPNQSITLPDDKVTLNGTASDPDGSITSYQWTQQEGPNNATLTGAENASMEAGGLIEGAYVFRLTVTDDQGALAYDEVSVTVEPAPNQQPNADAGPNQSITLPDDKVTLNGTASDPDGSITSYQWTQQEGPNNAILTGAENASMEAGGLIEGAYVFRLTVTDDQGATDQDSLRVTVLAASGMESPSADAGPNQSITLPDDKVTLNGTASDPDGSITSYQWTQQEGPSNAILTGAENASMEAGGLIEGAYVFRLTVTDDQGAQAYDEVSVTVEPAPNQQPNADAGPNQSITLPADKVTLNGTGTDPDGSITSYQWTQQQGPNKAILTGAENASMQAGGLIEGVYVFRLTVTDDQGALAYDEVSVTVEPAPNQQPNADAGVNQTITLPVNTVMLNGTATDPDGSIISYQWTQQQGPNKAILTGADNASMEASGLIEGAYVFRLTVTDDQGATDTDELTVTLLSAPPTVTAIITDASCNANDGAISLTLTGGHGPFNFEWSNGATTQDIMEIPAGDYQVTITDQNGISINESLTVNSTQANLIIAAEIDHTSCSKNDGAIRVTVSGGTAPYSFQWSTGEKTSAIQRLASGKYSLVVVDNSGCQKQVTFEVPIEPGETEFELNSKVTNASCSGTDGSISLEVLGENGPYTYTWFNGATTPNLTGLGIGGYQVLITDRHGCFMKEVFIVDQNSIPDPVIIQSGDLLLVEEQATYYQWYKDGIVLEGSTQNFLKFSEPGSYIVQIADGNCTNTSVPFVIEEVIESNSSSFTIQQVEIFPNPVANDLTVRIHVNGSAETNISLYDFQGTELMSQDLGIVTSAITTQLDVSSFPSGIYFIRITSGQEVLTKRLIKQYQEAYQTIE